MIFLFIWIIFGLINIYVYYKHNKIEFTNKVSKKENMISYALCFISFIIGPVGIIGWIGGKKYRQ